MDDRIFKILPLTKFNFHKNIFFFENTPIFFMKSAQTILFYFTIYTNKTCSEMKENTKLQLI